MLVVPVQDIVIAPNATFYFPLELLRKRSGDKGIAVGEKVVLIVAKEDEDASKPTDKSFYPIGVSGAITELDRRGFAVIRARHRVNLDEVWVMPDGTIELSISRRNDVDDLDEAAATDKLAALKREMHEFCAGFEWARTADYFIDQVDTLETAACTMSGMLNISRDERYAILAEDSRKARAELIERALYEAMEVGRIANEAATSQQEEYQRHFKESAIRRQMEHLQKELDEMHPENVTDVQKFEKLIAESGMNETARREAEKALNRLKQGGREGIENGMLYDYLDFVTGLSWKKEEARTIDLEMARKILDEDHYGLKKVKDRVIQQIAVMNLKRQQSGSILLFVGAPGTGKTSIGRSIARALGRKYARVSLGGVHDESDIRGHRRTYVGAMPGRIMDAVHKSGVSNPVMVLDEVDKLSASFHGSPASALLEVLDPEQNDTFTDHYMNVPYDLSDVLFICTANTADTIPEPLLNRMEVIQFNGYTPLEKLQIAREHLVPKSMEEMGIEEGRMTIDDAALETIIADYTMEAGVRGLRKRIDTLCRTMAVDVASDPDKTVAVTPQVVRERIDAKPALHSKALDAARPGVVTGLAWTPVGGDILYIETMLTKGKGALVITGQLGDVMKESAKIAISLVKKLFPKEAEKLSKRDLHIHVPAGAVPKDGPSAGVTLTTALASLLTGRAVDPHIAMTGEVALRGAVTPIGGLPEKLMAAQRAGITKVFIPVENEYDLKDVAQEVKDSIQIVPVKTVEDILRATGVMDGKE